MDYEARWHYLAMVQYCSRNERYDGRLSLISVRKASDGADHERTLAILVEAGLVRNVDGATFELVRIRQHIPPPYMRDPVRKERQRDEKRRSRLHAKGEHGECLPASCDRAGNADVSTDTGTGQDGPGQEVPPVTHEAEIRSEEPPWHPDDPDYAHAPNSWAS